MNLAEAGEPERLVKLWARRVWTLELSLVCITSAHCCAHTHSQAVGLSSKDCSYVDRCLRVAPLYERYTHVQHPYICLGVPDTLLIQFKIDKITATGTLGQKDQCSAGTLANLTAGLRSIEGRACSLGRSNCRVAGCLPVVLSPSCGVVVTSHGKDCSPVERCPQYGDAHPFHWLYAARNAGSTPSSSGSQSLCYWHITQHTSGQDLSLLPNLLRTVKPINEMRTVDGRRDGGPLAAACRVRIFYLSCNDLRPLK